MFTIVYAYRSLEPRVSVRRPESSLRISSKPRGFVPARETQQNPRPFSLFAHSFLSANRGISSSRRYFSFSRFSLRLMIILFLSSLSSHHFSLRLSARTIFSLSESNLFSRTSTSPIWVERYVLSLRLSGNFFPLAGSFLSLSLS